MTNLQFKKIIRILLASILVVFYIDLFLLLGIIGTIIFIFVEAFLCSYFFIAVKNDAFIEFGFSLDVDLFSPAPIFTAIGKGISALKKEILGI